MTLRLPHPLTAAFAAALLLVPAVCLAPTETEPNDDPGDGGYLGYLDLAAPPGLLEMDGALADGTDADIFRLDSVDDQPATLVLTGFTDGAVLNAAHSPLEEAEPVAKNLPYPLRLIPSWPIRGTAAERSNFVGVAFSLASGPNDYLLRVVRPGLDATDAVVKCVLKEAAGGDSFNVRLRHDPGTSILPDGAGDVEVFLRDFHAVVPASAFKVNAAGTKATFKAKAPGLTKVAYNAKKGIVQIKGKGIDFASSAFDGNLPVAVLSPGGAVAVDLAGTVLTGKKATKISAVRKAPK